MFGWLRKSSKEPSNENKPQPNAHSLPQHIQPHYVHVDDRVQPKALDQNFDAIDDQKDFNNADGIYTDRPHSVTAARPFFQATKHLDQQQIKQEVIQANYMSDNEQHYEDNKQEVTVPNIPPNNPINNNTNSNNNSTDDILKIAPNNNSNNNNIIKDIPSDIPSVIPSVIPSKSSNKNVIRSFQQRTNHTNIIETQTKNENIISHKPEIDEEITNEINHSMDSNASKQSNDNIVFHSEQIKAYTNDSKRNVNTNRKHSTSNTKTRGFSKRESKSKTSQRRRSTSKKNRSFTPESVANMNKANLPPAIAETNSQQNVKIKPYETEKIKRKVEIQPQQHQQTQVKESISYKEKYDSQIIIAIEQWIKGNNLYFPNNNKGEKLLIALLDSGIENPINDLIILSPYPDLHEIAAAAGLNILERRKFINAAHSKINEFQTTQSIDEVNESKQNMDIVAVKNENKKVVVMSTEEQQALARMDCVIEQLKHTRNLIKKRQNSIDSGGVEYEKIIRREFEILRDLLRQREQQLIDEMKAKIANKITMLSDLDHDMLMVLEECQKSKLNAQKLMKTNEQPRVSRQKWRSLMGRKQKVINIIEDTINGNIKGHMNKNVGQLIMTDMSMNDIMPSLPQPLMAQYMPSNSSVYTYPHHHRRHYDVLNNYLLNIFTKNMSQIHLELNCAGYAFNYTERNKMHKLLGEYGMICDVEQQLGTQLDTLFPSQFGGLSNDEIDSQNKIGVSHQYTKSINLNKIINKKEKEKEKENSKEIKPIKPLPQSTGVLPHTILYAKCVLINPEDWDQQMKDKKRNKKKNNDWKSYGNLHIAIEMSNYQINEWELIDKKLKQLKQKRDKQINKLNRFTDERFDAMSDWEEKEAFKLQKFFATIVGRENRKDIVTTQRIKEIEIQIAMTRKTSRNENENENDIEMGWISLGWIDIQSIVINVEEKKNEFDEQKESEEKDQIPEQYKTEFDEEKKNNKLIETKNSKLLKIPFQLKKHFQELMTQTFLAGLELELMTEIEDTQIRKDEVEKLVMKQLANDELFEFNSRNIDEFEKNFIICARGRIRDRINIKMTNMKLPVTPPEIVNKNKNIIMPLKSKKLMNESEEEKQVNVSEIDNKLRECDLIVFQSSFCQRKLINFSLLRPVVMVLKERKNALDSKYVNGFISIVGNESLQFIDPITGANAILSRELPPDVDSCGLIIDFIRLKHPAIQNASANMNENIPTVNDTMNENELLMSKLRNAGKKLSIVRVGGSIYNESNERVLCGRLDIYNIFSNSWINITEIEPKRENMATTMFYGRVCITGGNIKNNTFQPTNLCQEFSFSEKKWKPLKTMNKARFGHCMCTFDSKPTKLFVYGGEIVGGEWTNSVEIYNPQNRTWTEMKNASNSRWKRYGSTCCIWKSFGIIVIGGQCDKDQNSKHCELYNTSTNTWSNYQIKDLNYDHGIFPAVWCDSDDNCIYVASQSTVIDNKNKQNTKITYRVEMLDHPNNKWRIIKLNQNQFHTSNPYQIWKSAANWNANVVRKTIGVSIKISN